MRDDSNSGSDWVYVYLKEGQRYPSESMLCYYHTVAVPLLCYLFWAATYDKVPWVPYDLDMFFFQGVLISVYGLFIGLQLLRAIKLGYADKSFLKSLILYSLYKIFLAAIIIALSTNSLNIFDLIYVDLNSFKELVITILCFLGALICITLDYLATQTYSEINSFREWGHLSRVAKHKEEQCRQERYLYFEQLLDKRDHLFLKTQKMVDPIISPKLQLITDYFKHEVESQRPVAYEKHYTSLSSVASNPPIIHLVNIDSYEHYRKFFNVLFRHYPPQTSVNINNIRDLYEYFNALPARITKDTPSAHVSLGSRNNIYLDPNIDLNTAGQKNVQPRIPMNFNYVDLTRFVPHERHYTRELANVFKQVGSEMVSSYNAYKLGVEGEQSVTKALSQYRNFINLEGVRLLVPDSNGKPQTIESDNILITPHGIFILETKNIGSSGKLHLVITPDGQWKSRNFKGQLEQYPHNATDQNNRHIAYLETFLNENYPPFKNVYLNIQGAVVFANENVSIDNQNPRQTIIRISDIFNYITSFPIKYELHELQPIADCIKAQDQGSKPYPLKDYCTPLQQIMETHQQNSLLLAPFSDYVKDLNTQIRDEIINNPMYSEAVKNIHEISRINMELNEHIRSFENTPIWNRWQTEFKGNSAVD